MNQLEEIFWANFEFIENTNELLFNQTLSHVSIITLDNIQIFLIWEKKLKKHVMTPQCLLKQIGREALIAFLYME